MTNLMSFLSDLDLNELSKYLNDDYSTVVNKLDFTKKEDLDKLTEAVNTFKTSDSAMIQLVKSFMGEELDETLDKVLDYAKKTYEEAHKEEPVRPSEKISDEMQTRLKNIVTDYLNEVILPNTKLTKEQQESVSDGLFEFASWVYNR